MIPLSYNVINADQHTHIQIRRQVNGFTKYDSVIDFAVVIASAIIVSVIVSLFLSLTNATIWLTNSCSNKIQINCTIYSYIFSPFFLHRTQRVRIIEEKKWWHNQCVHLHVYFRPMINAFLINIRVSIMHTVVDCQLFCH